MEEADDDEDGDGLPSQPPDPHPDALEKAAVYSLGAVLTHCQTYDEPQPQPPSSQLLSLLNLLTVHDPKIRPSLTRIAQVTNRLIGNLWNLICFCLKMGRKTANERGIQSKIVVKALYQELMGSTEDVWSHPTVSKRLEGWILKLGESDSSPEVIQTSPVGAGRTNGVRDESFEPGSPIGHSTRVAEPDGPFPFLRHPLSSCHTAGSTGGGLDRGWQSLGDSLEPSRAGQTMYPSSSPSSSDEEEKVERFPAAGPEPGKATPQKTPEPSDPFTESKNPFDDDGAANPFEEAEEEFPAKDPFEGGDEEENAAFAAVSAPPQVLISPAPSRLFVDTHPSAFPSGEFTLIPLAVPLASLFVRSFISFARGGRRFVGGVPARVPPRRGALRAQPQLPVLHTRRDAGGGAGRGPTADLPSQPRAHPIPDHPVRRPGLLCALRWRAMIASVCLHLLEVAALQNAESHSSESSPKAAVRLYTPKRERRRPTEPSGPQISQRT